MARKISNSFLKRNYYGSVFSIKDIPAMNGIPVYEGAEYNQLIEKPTNFISTLNKSSFKKKMYELIPFFIESVY